MSRMTWIKPSFLWMMHRAGRGSKGTKMEQAVAFFSTMMAGLLAGTPATAQIAKEMPDKARYWPSTSRTRAQGGR